MRTVIVVYGGSGHGKDALSDMIAEEICALVDPPGIRSDPRPVLRCAFADPLKAVAMLLFGMPREVAYGNQQTKLSWKWRDRFSARELLQKVGTEGGRELYGDDLWVYALASTVKAQPEWVKAAVVSDGRFWSERTLGDFLPGVLVRKVLVWRPSAPDLGLPPTSWNRVKARLASIPLVGRIFGSAKLMHPSEAEVWEMRERTRHGEKLFDDFVVNDGSLEDLRAKAHGIAREVIKAVSTAKEVVS